MSTNCAKGCRLRIKLKKHPSRGSDKNLRLVLHQINVEHSSLSLYKLINIICGGVLYYPYNVINTYLFISP